VVKKKKQVKKVLKKVSSKKSSSKKKVKKKPVKKKTSKEKKKKQGKVVKRAKKRVKPEDIKEVDEDFFQLNLTEDMMKLIRDIAGENGLRISELLLKVKILDEFKIAEKLDLEVNYVRSLLYELYSKKIVSYSKARDKKKGWWIYSWTIHPKRIVQL